MTTTTKSFADTIKDLFDGRNNAGLRKKILACDSSRSVRSLATVIALTAQGKHSLERCAQAHPVQD